MDRVVELHDIDLDMFLEQKEALLNMIWDDSSNILWGLVGLLDYIHDQLDPP